MSAVQISVNPHFPGTRRATAWDKGWRGQKAGLPAAAVPYVSIPGQSYLRLEWLNGWRAARDSGVAGRCAECSRREGDYHLADCSRYPQKVGVEAPAKVELDAEAEERYRLYEESKARLEPRQEREETTPARGELIRRLQAIGVGVGFGWFDEYGDERVHRALLVVERRLRRRAVRGGDYMLGKSWPRLWMLDQLERPGELESAEAQADDETMRRSARRGR